MATLPCWRIQNRRAATERALRKLLLALIFPSVFLVASLAGAQPLNSGVAYLTGSQSADGSWQSPLVRSPLATTEALRALQALGAAPTSRASAVTRLEADLVEDTDDRARRLAALAGEGRSVASLLSVLLAEADGEGGWGLTPAFEPDPLDTSLGLAAIASQPAVGNDVLLPAFSSLLGAQRTDGGWPCVVSGDTESEIFCTGEALLALAAYRSRFLLTPQIDAGAGFLRGQLQPDGGFGPAGSSRTIATSMASLALASVSAFGSEVAGVIAYLQGQQRPDGSWDGDPYTTALALRALKALSLVPFCGDGLINRPGETCDGAVPAGLTCQALGLGPGTLTCSSQCTLNTSGCTAAPRCGDNLRNQPFEVCDGTDLAGQTCKSQGYATGNLACAADCLSFNVGTCNAAPTCGDGVVNQASELCDQSDLKGATCQSLGLGGGLLQCASDCNFDTSQCDTASFVIDNKGREFFVGLMPNPLGAVTASVQLTSDVTTSVTVQYPVTTPTFSQTVTVNPGQVTVVNLPAGTHSSWTAGRVLNNAVRVSSSNDFVLYLVNRAQFTSDAGMALPVDALGTSYIVTTYRGSAIVGQDRSQFLVVAPFDNTTVTITPAATVVIPSPGANAPPNVPFTIKLNRGQGFRAEAAFSGNDLSGTVIESDRPVAMLNGNLCTNVPTTTAFCDHIFEVAHPLRAWGTTALVRNLPNRNGGSIYRIMSSVDGTHVSLDGAPQATLNRGKFLETGPLTGNHVFAADHPIFVTQFMTGSTSAGAVLGDPSMVNVIPPDQYLKSYTFSTVGGAQFRNHFLTLIAPTVSIGDLTLDGAAVAAAQFTPIGTTGYSSALLPIAEGSHTTASSQPHGITVEGINQDDSYIYPGGARLEFINQFCGDGRANRDPEECDGNDFRGSNCAAFGFSAGFLQCTSDCRIDTSQCSGFVVEDRDGDGFPANKDCNDLDPEVNPGMPEIPGNGIDDDCNPATPDVLPQGVASCRVSTDRLNYAALDVVRVEAEIRNLHDTFSLTGLTAVLKVLGSGGASAFEEARLLAPLPPGARAQQAYAFGAVGKPPGSYTAEVTVSAGSGSLAVCSAAFTIDSSAGTGAGLAGDLTLQPEKVNAGDPSNATYVVRNQGNAPLADLAIRVILVDLDSGAVMGELTGTANLAPGESFTATGPFSTVGLATNKTYLAVLLAKPAGSDAEQTLDSATLTVVNAPPVCAAASGSPASLWPPNHKLAEVVIGGVTDPDGDPVTIKVTGVLQDERTDELGSGDTCPDATGIGTARASVRAERSGRQDGRVYHVFFQADDGRGGRCEGEVKVCVTHDGRPGETCVDEGALFDSTRCR
ncbi:MAG: MopE-related protein [Thermoanaerobaculia bacterium]